jgi:type I restriction enzyme S subunit
MKRWPTVKLRSVTSKVGSGATPRGGGAVYRQSGVPLIRSMNIHFDGFRRDGLVYLDDKEASLLDAVKVQSNDVLFNITGASIGRVTTAPAEMTGARVNQHVCIIRPSDELMPRFLSYYLGSPEQQALVGSNQIGGTRQAVTKGMLLNWEIPLPLLAEQERIVNLLDRADGIRKLRAQADHRTANLVPALFYELFGDPSTNSKGWPVKLAGELMEACDYGTSQKANEAGRGIPVLRMNNVTSEGQLDLEEIKTVELAANELAKQRLQAGDVLFNRTNSRDLVGKTGLWDGRFEAVAASYFIRVRVRNDIEDPLHFTTFMNLPFMKRRLAEMARGAVGQANINASELRAIRVPVPLLPLQKEFAGLVTEIRGLEAEQAASRRRLEDLFQSLLHRAVQGEL